MRIFGIVFLALLVSAPAFALDTEKQSVRYEVLAEGLDHPWAMAFLPDGRMLVTERKGRLRIIGTDGRLQARPVGGVPAVVANGQGGLLDVQLHPRFIENRLVYLSWTGEGPGGYGTEIGRGEFRDGALHNLEVLFRLFPKSHKSWHFGSRLVFDRNGNLFITLGDRGERQRAQDLGDHAGSVIRLHDDGRVPADNPFVGRADVRPEIFSYGHRNMQGATLNPIDGSLWTHEHGPQGGDEINVIRPGVNYGWPVITWGVNYGTGTPIGEGTHRQGMVQPLYYWVPSIAPSGMTFYDGKRFPAWRGDLFVGSLKFRLLVRLEIRDGQVVHEERMLADVFGRIRDVRQGPDGLLYLLTDDDNGKLVRLLPDS